MKNIYLNNRSRFIKEMKKNSLLILLAGEENQKRGDEFYSFAPKRNFLYLTGINKPKIALVIYKGENDKSETELFVERTDEVMAKWVGAVLTCEEAKKISGVEKVKHLDELNQSLNAKIFNKNITDIYMDIESRYWNNPLTEDIVFANMLKERMPHVNIINAHTIFAELRLTKSKDEIKNIQKAIDITREGLCKVMKNLKPNMKEYEAEAYFDFTLKKNGVREFAFHTIAASGKNATILHYHDNNAVMADGQLILLDLGASHNYYSADITRTYPVNGRFTDRQKELYNIVLGANMKVIEAIKPGLEFSKLNEIVINYYQKELLKIGLIKSKDEVSKYYYHGVSHLLGLETHDIGRHCVGKIEKGMVFTVEPGLYIEEEEIGIRIEDDILVTEKGALVLSSDIIKTVDEIEAFMANSKHEK